MAPGATVNITITTGLIEKLAGIKKALARKAPQTGSFPLQAPARLPGLSAEAAHAVSQDAQLARALKSTAQIGSLLLSQEEAETRKVGKLAEELLAKHRVAPRTPSCQPERDACVECYKQHPQDALRCADTVNAYVRCSQLSFAQRAN